MSYTKQYELGLIGLALMRTWLIGDKDIIKDILKEFITTVDTLKKTSSPILVEVNTLDVHKGYQRWADTYDNPPNLLIEVEEPVVKSLLRELPRGDVLDAGCGTGRYSKFLHSLGHNVTGVDISEEMLNKARTNSPKTTFIQGDFTALPLKDNSVDLAVSALALTHLQDIASAVSEFSRVVRKGGHIVLSDMHPWIVAFGGQADFQDKTGKYGFIRNYVHWHSVYMQVFSNIGLRVVKCIEPIMNQEHIKLAQGKFELSRTTMSAAFEGLPIALIWLLEKMK